MQLQAVAKVNTPNQTQSQMGATGTVVFCILQRSSPLHAPRVADRQHKHPTDISCYSIVHPAKCGVFPCNWHSPLEQLAVPTQCKLRHLPTLSEGFLQSCDNCMLRQSARFQPSNLSLHQQLSTVAVHSVSCAGHIANAGTHA